MEDEKVRQELRSADDAIRAGRYDVADHWLTLAAHAGAEPLHISELGRKLRLARAMHEANVGATVRIGFAVALVGYVAASCRQPVAWTIPVWLALIFLLIPGIAGAVVGWRHAGERTLSKTFMDGMRSGAWAMACYACFNLLVLGGHLQTESTQVGDEFVAGVFTVVLFTAAAGAISGIFSVAASRIFKRGDAT